MSTLIDGLPVKKENTTHQGVLAVLAHPRAAAACADVEGRALRAKAGADAGADAVGGRVGPDLC